jgi:phosphoglycolate phosphatase-like HAD superfamily hydrolase
LAVEAVVFDVGETLVDETGMWTRVAEAGGVTPFTLMAGLGATIALERPHDDVWELLGIEHPAGTWTMDDWYPDARPCLERLRAAG